MRHIYRFMLVAFLLLLPVMTEAQTIRMEDGYAAFDYPDTWMVLSPQLCTVYAPLLEKQGMDPAALRSSMEKGHILSCAYNPDFSQRLSVLCWSDDTSQSLFDIGRVETGERRRIRAQAENNTLWESSGMRTQDAEWQTVSGRYWLYLHYLRTENGETVGRGLRYITIHNGQYIALDWQISNGRFSNRDLGTFKSRVQQIVFLQELEEPMQTVALDTELPTETSSGKIEISGTATPGAELVLTIESESILKRTAGETTAGPRGSFKIEFSLEKEGEVDLVLTAHADGMIDQVLQSTVTYNSKTLPVSGIDDSRTVSEDKLVITGKTLAGTQLQLLTPYGISKKRAANDGSFSFELNTKEEGTYNYTLVLDKSGYLQRRYPFTVIRIKTDDQQKADIRKTAVRLKYRDLQKDQESNLGKVMSIYGPVTEVSTGGDTSYIRMQFTKSVGNTWTNPVIIVCEGTTEVTSGQYISAVVTVDGIYMEQDDAGNDVAVPRFQLLFIDRVE